MSAREFYYMTHSYLRRMIRAGKDRESYLNLVLRGNPHPEQLLAAQFAIRNR